MVGSGQTCGTLQSDAMSKRGDNRQVDEPVATSAPQGCNPLVSIIVLNYKGKHDTLECLRSLDSLDYQPFNVIVVDNASDDGIAQALVESHWRFPLKIIENEANLGYAGGNNVGMKYAKDNRADYLLVLNNDTEAAPKMLAELLAAVRRWPASGVFGPRIYFFDRKDVVWSNGDIKGPKGTGFCSPGQGKHDDQLTDDEGSPDSVVGAALFFSAKLLASIGYFDERFFLHYEDHDFCARARAAGYDCRIVPTAKLWHKVGASIGPEESPLVRYLKTRNRLLFAEKHLEWGAFLRFLVREFSHLAPRLVVRDGRQSWLNRLAWASREWAGLCFGDPLYKARRKGLWDYLFRRFGDVPEKVLKLNQQWKQTHHSRALPRTGAGI